MTVTEFCNRLMEEMLIVPVERGNPAHDVMIDQANTILYAYFWDREIWEEAIGKWEDWQSRPRQ